MADIINIDYFIGEILIPNPDNGDLAKAITQYEKEILIDVLGYELYSLFVADGYDSPSSQRFLDILNGKEFEIDYCGKTIKQKWNGLKDEATYQSLIAYFTYYKYVKRTNDHLGGIGNTMFQPENGKRTSPIDKMSNAWKRMLELYGHIPSNCLRQGIYTWNFWYLGNCEVWETPTMIYNPDPSLYNFLASNIDTYPEWVFKPKGTVNVFGI